MKLPPHLRLSRKVRRGRTYRLYRLGEFIAQTGYVVQDARKPYDLVFPVIRLIDLINQTKVVQWDWLAEQLKLDKRDRGQWPHI